MMFDFPFMNPATREVCLLAFGQLVPDMENDVSKGLVTYRDSTQLNSSVELGLSQFSHVTRG